MDSGKLSIVNIPAHWIPGRDTFVKLRVNTSQLYQYEEVMPYAEIAASVFVWFAHKNRSYNSVSYQELFEIESPTVLLTSSDGNSITATRLSVGIRVLLDLGWIDNDEKNELLIINGNIWEKIVICDLISCSFPCA